MESKTILFEEQIKEKSKKIFDLPLKVIFLPWATLLLGIVVFSWVGAVLYFFNSGYIHTAELGFKLMKTFVIVYTLLVFVYLMKGWFELSERDKLRHSNLKMKFKEEIKEEIIKELKKNGRRK